MFAWTLLLGILTGCGYPEEDFEAEYREAYCVWAGDCAYYASADACVEAYADWSPDRADCTYDDAAARDCVKAMEERACPDGDGGGEMPAACNAVFACTGEEE